MKNLLAALRDADAALLPLIAKRWNASITNLNATEATKTLNAAMLNAENAARVWDTLSDEQRGALQTVVGGGGKMLTFHAERILGKIRKMGAGAIEREKPHERPSSLAEALFYRGLIFEGYEQSPTGARPIVYVPPDLLEVLPTRKTGYANLADLPATPAETATVAVQEDDDYDEEATIEALDGSEVTEVRPADTTIVDDMATLLAYLQTQGAAVEGDLVGEAVVGALTMAQADRKAVLAHLLVKDESRLDFLLGLGISADLIEIQSARAFPKRAEARRWLEDKRAGQLKVLANAWRDSTLYRDLWHVPGLNPEPTGWPYDPVVARQAVLRFLKTDVPRGVWWSLDDFITNVKEIDPDFQRPGGDYESWYIRNDDGDYLNGFESWDAVEGALLEFYLLGPLHWLGMSDLANDGFAARLTAYGRGFVGGEAWPAPAEPEEKIALTPEGTLTASRKVSRIDRFQLARFTTWNPVASATAPFAYRLTPQSIRAAGEQGITPAHIAAFIKRMLPEDVPVPGAFTKLLEQPQGGPATQVSLERLLVLRTTARETLDFIWETPALRRYLGARLGDMAVVVRADQWEALRDALSEKTIQVDVSGV
ncbi:MAG: hypothetical protein SF029_22440 [bacterium]|nr:hypothetical protein [bacterium]